MQASQTELGGRDAGRAAPDALSHEPLTDLVTNLSRDVGLLLRQELDLAKQEAAGKFARIKAEAAGMAVGGVLLHVGVLVLAAALVLGLAEILPAWLAALVVAIVLLAVGAALLMRGTSRLRGLTFAPKTALENVQRDVQAVEEAVR